MSENIDKNKTKFELVLDHKGVKGYKPNKLGKYESQHPLTLYRIFNLPEVKGTEIEDVIMGLLYDSHLASNRFDFMHEEWMKKDKEFESLKRKLELNESKQQNQCEEWII